MKDLFVHAKSLHFLLFGASATVTPFFSVFYSSLGLKRDVVGLLTSIPRMVGFLSGPIWTGIADKTRTHKLVMLINVIFMTGSLLLMGLVPAIGSSLFFLIPAVVLYSFFSTPLFPLTDYAVLVLLKDKKELYGRQRLWGAVSWGTTAFISGTLMDYYGIDSMFYCFAIGMFAYLVSMLFLPRSISEVEDMDVKAPIRFRQSFKVLLKNPQVILALIPIFILGIGSSIIGNYLFLYLLDYLHASETLLGLSISFTVLMELPFFFFSKHMLNFFKVRGMIVIAHVAYTTRVLTYTFLTNAWWVLPIELLHGVTFASLWAAMVAHASSVAPKGLEASAQGLFGAVGSLGSGLGAVFGGLVYQHYGPYVLFRGSALMVACSCVFFLATFRPKPANVYTVLPEDQGDEEDVTVELNTIEAVEVSTEKLKEEVDQQMIDQPSE